MYYCAYGSNLNLEQMKYRCPTAKPILAGEIMDYELVFRLHADIKPAKGKKVPCMLWECKKSDWDALDRYEGFPNYYIDDYVYVKAEDGKTYKAIAYIMTKENALINKGVAPTEHYYNVIKQGYFDCELDLEYLKKARRKV